MCEQCRGNQKHWPKGNKIEISKIKISVGFFWRKRNVLYIDRNAKFSRINHWNRFSKKSAGLKKKKNMILISYVISQMKFKSGRVVCLVDWKTGAGRSGGHAFSPSTWTLVLSSVMTRFDHVPLALSTIPKSILSTLIAVEKVSEHSLVLCFKKHIIYVWKRKVGGVNCI